MRNQRGITLSGVLKWGVVIGLVAILGMKIAPSAIEYFKAMKGAKATVANLPPNPTVADVRKAFAKYAEIDHLDLKPEDLEITKEGNQVVINISYDKKIRLFGNVNLLIEYRGSTGGSSSD